MSVDRERGISTRGQKDFDKLYPHFRTDIEALDADVPKRSGGEIVLRLMQIVAGANEAHNLVQTPIGLGFFSRLPLTFAWFADGLAVMSASAQYQAALGTRVARIGDKTPEQMLTELAPYIPHENDAWLRMNAPGLLRSRVVLEHFGLTDSAGQVVLTLQRLDGAVFPLAVKTTDPRTKMLSALEALHAPPTLYQSHPQRYYWHQYLQNSMTLYIHDNVWANDPQLPFSDFAERVMADAGSHDVKRVVIDMRGNGGGNSRIIRPLKRGLAARQDRSCLRSDRAGDVFVRYR